MARDIKVSFISDAKPLVSDVNKMASAIEDAAAVYDSMTDYQKTYVSKDTVSTLTALVTKLNAMIKTAEETAAKAKEEATATAGAAARQQ